MKIENFIRNMLGGIKDMLADIGIPNIVVQQVDKIIYMMLILLVAFLAGRVTHLISARVIARIQKHKQFTVLGKLVEFDVLKRLSSMVSPLVVLFLLPMAFTKGSALMMLVENITWIYFTITIMLLLNALLSSLGGVAYSNKKYHDKPIKGFVQIAKIVVYLIAAIVIISILTNKSPFYLIGGLGAFAAVLMLVFKDTILGFVGGILLLENDMVRLGDWIEMPGSAINGVVVDMSLTIVKVRNFDNTIVTIPPYSLISGSFINWRGMSESGGRRIMRGYTIKTDNIRTCSEAFLNRMRSFSSEMERFIDIMSVDAGDVGSETSEEAMYGTIDTNLGLFRAYVTYYLKNHPLLRKDMLVMVRTLSPTEYGLPLQIYCFTSDTDWSHYESIQSGIMEHLAAAMPAFDLIPYQSSSSHDSMINGLVERGYPIEKIVGIPVGALPK